MVSYSGLKIDSHSKTIPVKAMEAQKLDRIIGTSMPAVGKMLDCRTGVCNLSDLPDAFCRNPWSHPEADLVPPRTQGL